jgi:glyoxylase-like metal-dependent hydrolase (beta-lactamase superfamily II)
VLEPYGERLWLVLSKQQTQSFGLVTATGLVAPTDGGALVVDPGWNDAQAAWILDAVERLSGRPAAAVVATHSHGDRVGGLAEVARRNIPIHGGEGTAHRLPAVGLGHVQGTWFREGTTLSLGGTDFALFAPGPGHAPDNIVVYVPGERVLFGGCFIKDATSKNLGNLGDANVPEWEASLDRLVARFPEAARVIPGHGSPGGPELYEHTRKLIQAQLQK